MPEKITLPQNIVEEANRVIYDHLNEEMTHQYGCGCAQCMAAYRQTREWRDFRPQVDRRPADVRQDVEYE